MAPILRQAQHEGLTLSFLILSFLTLSFLTLSLSKGEGQKMELGAHGGQRKRAAGRDARGP